MRIFDRDDEQAKCNNDNFPQVQPTASKTRRILVLLEFLCLMSRASVGLHGFGRRY